MEALARFKEHDIQPKVQSKEQELADEAPAVGGEVAALHHGGGGGGGGEAEHRREGGVGEVLQAVDLWGSGLGCDGFMRVSGD